MYILIIGSKSNATNQADFEAAVENVGGAAVCIGGVTIDGDTCVQAVSINSEPNTEVPASWWQRLFFRAKRKK